MNNNLKDIFDKSRQELLDMGLRGNTLLSLGKGARVLDIVDEKSIQVFDTLVNAQKPMAFAPAPKDLESEDGEGLTVSQLKAHLEQQVGNKRHDDNELQTALFKKTLENRLLKLGAEALSYVQEQGVDLLYLAAGFIKWYEDDSSDKARYAPLVLIPVELFRSDAGDAYKIRYTDAELGANLTLAAKLKMEFGIILPEFEEQEEGYNLADYFNAVEVAISKEKRWSVARNKLALSFFSFGKFQMYQDLADEAWPDGKKPSQHPVIEKLFGEGFEPDAALLENTPMDVNRVEAVQLVLDSDSSQTEAVLAAKSGVSLVIQGPPGTGKSQTITNIISQALADDKKVLFVAEKMAALDVVKRRLDNCHIGDAVLELHSHKANKKAVLTSLHSGLMQHAPVSPERSEDIEKLVALRAQLDEYCGLVNQPIAETGVSYQVALGYLLKYESEIERSRFDLSALPEFDLNLNVWSSSHLNKVIGKLKELVDYLEQNGAPASNLYGTTKSLEVSPAEHKDVIGLCAELTQAQTQFIATVAALAKELAFNREVGTYAEASSALKSLRLIAQKPAMTGLNLDDSTWKSKEGQILNFAKQGFDLQQQKARINEQFLPAALESDWMQLRGVLTTTGTKWWRFLSGEYRKAKATYAGMCRNGMSGANADWVKQIDQLLDYKANQSAFADSAQSVIAVIGEHYQKDQTDWSQLLKPIEWVYQARTGLEDDSFDPSIANHLNTNVNAVEACSVDELDAMVDKRLGLIQQVCAKLEVDEATLVEQLDSLELDALTRIGKEVEQLYELARFNRLAKQLNEYGLNDWNVLAFSWTQAPELLLTGFKFKFYSALANHYYETTPTVRLFDRTEHEKAIEQFSDIDGQLFHFAQERLVEELHSRLPNPAARGEVETLRREFNKKRRQMPIRRLVNKAGRAIQQIKPVFMMSPMSVATYLEPGAIDFDLVIFDEASQVKVADALGAILRGKQVIVVGDTKQMPPTNFFGKVLELDDDEAEESKTADMESILGMFLAAGTPETMLKWHYRSRHESLIAVSNQEFYDNKLMIFPSSGINPQAKGLSFNHLPHTTYQQGAGCNKDEAAAVAEAVMEHARTKPNQTLGVVAFSVRQRDAILLEVERLRKLHPELEPFFGEHEEGEDFFVKNLENVQGDERDTIFISIGYGRTTEGKLPMRFGPLNNDGGERRLNVLISRARMCMEVFSNFKAEDMQTTDASPFGVRALKNFLSYAETKVLVKHRETGKAPDSPFEEEVISVIRGLGYSVEPQVGCAGFYIDIAVRDSNKPGRYMLAVECDGATYHSSKSARDRDRIRQGVLEGLGWRFHRIWSTDWFRNRHRETERLHDALREAEAFYRDYDENKPAATAQSKPNKAKAQIERVEVEISNTNAEYNPCPLSELSLRVGEAIPDVSPNRLTDDVMTVLKAEAPMHTKLLTIRLLSAVGATRAGARINAAITDVLARLEKQGKVQLDGDFINLVGAEVVVRNRQAMPNNERKFEYVSDEEIWVSAYDVVQDTFLIEHDELVKSITETLGFSATSKAMKEKVEAVIAELLQQEHLVSKGGIYSIVA
ncbi:DUF3320 domain-containing protein [Vibrio vulnificus]|nr:DUF3320 domain-containing protein [Vibrio vulnificus]EIJ0968455.1 DUF3320 domain-containing protein [Vibrio vulnificus]HAS8480848.1 DUF3320 domain-containing protein [Vibrio vulnificus]